MLLERDELLRELKVNFLAAQNHMKLKADKKRREVSYEEGDLVLIKLRPYHQHSVERSSHKLSKRYYGSFKVLAKIREVAYRVELPPGARIHNVFHVSILRLLEVYRHSFTSY